MSRPDFITWATSKGGVYLHDKQKPTLATWQPYQVDILRHVFPAGDQRLPYSRILWSDVKKSGKTELSYGVHLWFGLFVDVPGEQYVLANDFEGAKSRVWRALEEGLKKNPLLKENKDWRVIGSQISITNGTTIKAIATDYRGEAGSNHSLATVDEPWGVIHDSGLKLMTEFGPVPTRENSTIFYTGYQGFEGQSEFWHNLIDEAKAGEPVPELMHIEDGDGNPACWRNGRMFLFWNHKGMQPWHTAEYYTEERRAYKGRLNEFIRVHENRRVKNATAFCSEEQWDKLLDPELRALNPLGDTRSIVLGVDAATKHDCCALAATTWNAEKKRVELVYSKIWYPDDGQIVLIDTIGPEIVRLHQTFYVAAVYYDPFQMAAIAEMCKRVGVEMVEFPQTSRRLQSDTLLHDLLWGGNFAHYGDPELKQHITNALTKETERGQRIVKELTIKKVDGAVATAMSALGTVETLTTHTSGMEGATNPFFGG